MVQGVDELCAEGGDLVAEIWVVRHDAGSIVSERGAHGSASGVGDGAQVVIVIERGGR